MASGYLRVVDTNDVSLKTYREGDVIEDRSLVWFPNNRHRNRRKYDVISVGYSQVRKTEFALLKLSFSAFLKLSMHFLDSLPLFFCFLFRCPSPKREDP